MPVLRRNDEGELLTPCLPYHQWSNIYWCTAQWQRLLQLRAGLQCGKQRQKPQQRNRLSTGVDRPVNDAGLEPQNLASIEEGTAGI